MVQVIPSINPNPHAKPADTGDLKRGRRMEIPVVMLGTKARV
jgi:hypothetical protein